MPKTAFALGSIAALLLAGLAAPGAVAAPIVTVEPKGCLEGPALPVCDNLSVFVVWKCGDIVIPIGSPGPYDPTDCEPVNALLPAFHTGGNPPADPPALIPLLVGLLLLCAEVSWSQASGWSAGWDCFA